MSRAFVPVLGQDGQTYKVDTCLLTVGANNVSRQVSIVGDPLVDNLAYVTSANALQVDIGHGTASANIADPNTPANKLQVNSDGSINAAITAAGVNVVPIFAGNADGVAPAGTGQGEGAFIFDGTNWNRQRAIPGLGVAAVSNGGTSYHQSPASGGTLGFLLKSGKGRFARFHNTDSNAQTNTVYVYDSATLAGSQAAQTTAGRPIMVINAIGPTQILDFQIPLGTGLIVWYSALPSAVGTLLTYD